MSSSSVNIVRSTCDCGLPSPLKTSWTTENCCREFIGCPNYMNKRLKCDFFEWQDPKMTDREKITELWCENRRLKAANLGLMEFELKVSPSMLEKRCQITLPARVARALGLREGHQPTILETPRGKKYDLIFCRQKNRGGGWRGDRKGWSEVVQLEAMLLGDTLQFKAQKIVGESLHLKVTSVLMRVLARCRS